MQNILLLGADPATVSLYRMQFEQAGVALASAELVEPLGDFIRLAQPDAVLLDITQSKSNTEELIRGLRSQAEFKDLPVFTLTDPRAGTNDSSSATRAFPKVPARAPEVVKAVAQSLANVGQTSPLAATPPAANPATEIKRPTVGAQRSTFPEEVGATVRQLSESFRAFSTTTPESRSEPLQKMQEHVRNLRRVLLTAKCPALTAFTSALARLLITLAKDTGRVNSSSLKTLSASIDALTVATLPTTDSSDFEKGPVRIIVLDDDALSRRALQFALGCPDVELEDCASTGQALDSLRDEEFDVVFTDFKMVRSGEFSAELKKIPGHADLPIVVVTASAEFDVRIQSTLNGTADVITKPFTPSEMVVKAFTFAIKRRMGKPSSVVVISGTALEPGDRLAPSEDQDAPREVSERRSASGHLNGGNDCLVPAPSLPRFTLSPSRAMTPEATPTNLEETSKTDMRSYIEPPASQANELREKLDAAEQRVEAQTKACTELAAAKEQAEAAVAASLARLKELELRVEGETNARQAADQQLGSLQQRAGELEQGLNRERTALQELQSQQTALQQAEANLKAQLTEREGTLAELRSTLARVESQAAAEAARRDAVEKEAQAAAEKQRLLEKQLEERQRAAEQQQATLAPELQRLQHSLEGTRSENASLKSKIHELERAISQHNTSDVAKAPADSEHGEGRATEAPLQRKFQEMAAYELVTGELVRVRSQLRDERSQRQRLEASIGEAEGIKEELSRKLETSQASERTCVQTIESLQMKLQEAAAKVESLEASNLTHARENRRLQLRAKDLEQELTEMSNQLSTQAVLEQSRRRHEAELEACMLQQQAELANAKAALAKEDAAIKRAREKIQSALCRVIHDLDSEKDSLFSEAVESEELVQASAA